MSALIDQPSVTPVPAPLPAGRFGGLLRAEAHRFAARRFIRVLLLLAVVGWLATVAIGLSQFASVTPERLADARTSMQEAVALQEQHRQECLTDPSRTTGVPAEEFCGPPVQAGDFRAEDFLSPPFSLSRMGTDGAVGFGIAAAALAFLLGATFVGAEWSTRSMVALLFWEPRRGRVMAAKLIVVAGACAVLGVVAELGWLAMAGLLQSVAGDGTPLPADLWPELFGTQARAVLLVALVGLLGFGLTNLTRNTGAALGIGFVYFAVLQTAITVLRPSWQPWLLTNNIGALVVPGGVPLYTFPDSADQAMSGSTDPVVYQLGNLQAGVFLCLVTAAVVGAGMALFARRDLH
jgi:ABC-type transport system involved in multi-copper enzyme maturation permease subunit